MIVGEVTGGGANPFEYRRIDDHFALSLPEQRSVNPITGTNWEGVGIDPDIKVPSAEALRAAHLAALEKIKEAAADARHREELDRAIAVLKKAGSAQL